MQNDLLSIGRAAKEIGVSVDTLRRWEKRGLITSHRSPTGRRYYNLEELKYVFAKKPAFRRRETSLPPQPTISAKPEKEGLFSTRNLLVLFSFLISLYIILLIFFLLQPILVPTPLSPVP